MNQRLRKLLLGRPTLIAAGRAAACLLLGFLALPDQRGRFTQAGA